MASIVRQRLGVPTNVSRRSTAVRPAIAPSRRRLVVVAFRDAHRAETLEQVSKEFSNAWAHSLCQGVSQHTMEMEIGPMCDEQIEVRSVHPMGCSQAKGVNALGAKLMRDHKALNSSGMKAPGAPCDVQVLLSGTNDSSDTSFTLLKLPAMASSTSGGGPSAACQPSYLLLKMDWLLDDTVRRVMSVMERGQLAGGFDLPIKKPQQLQGAVDKPQQRGCAQTPEFPRHLIQPWALKESKRGPGAPCPDMVERVGQVLKSWVEARSTGSKTADMMAAAGCTEDFQMYDGYGLMPMMCEMASTDSPNTCMLKKQQVQDVLEAVKKHYAVQCQVVDWGVSLNEAAGFVHWKATHHDRLTGKEFDVEGMEVNLFEPTTGNLRAVYLFGDALDFEGGKLANITASPSSSSKMA